MDRLERLTPKEVRSFSFEICGLVLSFGSLFSVLCTVSVVLIAIGGWSMSRVPQWGKANVIGISVTCFVLALCLVCGAAILLGLCIAAVRSSIKKYLFKRERNQKLDDEV